MRTSIIYIMKEKTRQDTLYIINIYCIGGGRVSAAANPFIVVVVVATGVFRSRSHASQVSYS
jgi:hypothetical protein